MTAASPVAPMGRRSRAHVQANACLDQGRRQGPVSYPRSLNSGPSQRVSQACPRRFRGCAAVLAMRRQRREMPRAAHRRQAPTAQPLEVLQNPVAPARTSACTGGEELADPVRPDAPKAERPTAPARCRTASEGSSDATRPNRPRARASSAFSTPRQPLSHVVSRFSGNSRTRQHVK